jgi:ABC-type Fe3+-siderophore transport system, permease component
VLLTYSDIAARMVYNPYETPIGIFTALIGVPFFIVMARKERD